MITFPEMILFMINNVLNEYTPYVSAFRGDSLRVSLMDEVVADVRYNGVFFVITAHVPCNKGEGEPIHSLRKILTLITGVKTIYDPGF
jgi:hypothetical protein